MNNSKKTKICHVITCLDQGGAQTMLIKLLSSNFLKDRFDQCVFSFMGDGVLGDKIRNLGVPVYSVQTSFSLSIIHSMLVLCKFLRQKKIKVVQTWTYHSDFLGGIAAKLAGIKKVFWGVRHANLDWKVNSISTIITAYLSILFSYLIPIKIIYCSILGKKLHEELGYCQIGELIPNGFDASVFRPSKSYCSVARQELGIPEGATVVGCVGRFHSIKGQEVLLEAFNLLEKDHSEVYLLFCGRGVEQALKSKVAKKNKVIFLPETRNVERIYQLVDIFCLPSLGEAFPNVLAEAMLSENFCVACDVGDVAYILKNYGIVCRPNSINSLYTALNDALKVAPNLRLEIAKAGRKSIVENFSNELIISRYYELYTN